MQLSASTISAILALTSVTAAAPRDLGRRSGPDRLSLTAQIQLADTYASHLNSHARQKTRAYSVIDRYSILPDDSDFVFDFNQQQANPGKDGQLVAANCKTFPALFGTNSGRAFGRVDACGKNTLHVHPRSAELQIVTAGRLMTEMVPEKGVLDKDGNRRVIRTKLTANKMALFPMGAQKMMIKGAS